MFTITEKILAKASSRKKVSPGENIWIDVDILMTHDVCGSAVISIFKDNFGSQAPVFDRDKVVIIPDHYIYTADPYAKRNIDILRDFVKEQKITHFYDPFTDSYKGVCHIALAQEGHLVPGEVLFGTDSHTCTAGAFGMFATGVGNTDAAFIMGTGQLWVKVPETMRFVFNGKFPPHIMAKDMILQIIGDISVSGATYKTLEFSGEGIHDLSMEERMTLCNMSIEAGAKNGIIETDETTLTYLKDRVKKDFEVVFSDKNAKYCFNKEYDASSFRSVVAKPHSPDNLAYADDLGDISLDRAYVGSCTGGKITDFRAVAQILNGRTVKIETLIVPATREVEQQLESEKIDGKSLKSIFIESGCSLGNPSCGACLGGPEDTFGRSRDGEVVISTTNRNFVGRMGSQKAFIYLASPYTVAASALTGCISDPKSYF